MENTLSKQSAEAAGSLELGTVLGQRKAFSLIAGRCSAAEAEALRRLREQRLYQPTKMSWRAFCPARLGMSATHANRLIGYLEEFGPAYFELTQLTRLSPDAYRAIAPAVKDGHIHWREEAIALLPENSDKVAAAVAGLRGAIQAAKPRQSPDPMDALKQRTDEVIAGWGKLVSQRVTLPPAMRQMMKNLIGKARQDMQRLEGQVW